LGESRNVYKIFIEVMYWKEGREIYMENGREKEKKVLFLYHKVSLLLKQYELETSIG
jgi:hypothetical protein